jgi:hypothetical protein
MSPVLAEFEAEGILPPGIIEEVKAIR